MDAFFCDVRYAVRGLRRAPEFSAVAVATLALGIGAATTAFALAYSVLVKPLPFPEPERLVWITSYNTQTSDGGEFFYNSNRMSQFLDWQQSLATLRQGSGQQASFEQLAAWSGTNRPDVYTVSGSGTPERVNGLRVTQQMLPMLGAQPATYRGARCCRRGSPAPVNRASSA